MGMKHTVLLSGQALLSVASTVLAWLCGSKANETEMGAAVGIFVQIDKSEDSRFGFQAILKQETLQRYKQNSKTPYLTTSLVQSPK